MDHRWLDDFLVLARTRSFSKTAAERHVTQPQLSRRIRALEEWAGAVLVDREQSPVVLTAAGENFLASARAAVNSLVEGRDRIRRMQGGHGLTLATGKTLARTFVPDLVVRWRKASGDFPLRLITGSLQSSAAALEKGVADFLLSYAHPRLSLALDDRSFEAVTLSHEELVAVSAPRADGRPLHPLPGTSKQPVPLLTYSNSLAMAHIVQDALSRHDGQIHTTLAVESDFAESLHELAIKGLGAAWLPGRLIKHDLESGRLVPAFPGMPAIRFEIRLIRARTSRSVLQQTLWNVSLAK